MKYSVICTACNTPIYAEADTENDAIERLIVAGREHEMLYHTGMKPYTQEEMETYIRSTFKVVGSE
jgi:hypothetical protein